MSVEKQGQPEFIVDNFKQKFKVSGEAANGTFRLLMVDGAAPVSCTLIPMNVIGGISDDSLCGFYPLIDETDEEIKEILLPVGVVRGGADGAINGVVMEYKLDRCVRGDQWYPDFLSESRVWRALARLCTGVELAAKAGLHQKQLTREALYADPISGMVCLNMTEAAVRTVQQAGEAGSAAETARALILLTFDVLNGRNTGDGLSGEDIDSLPEIYPRSDQLRELFKRALIDGDEPDLKQWSTLLEGCAAEMDSRLGVSQNDPADDANDEEPELETGADQEEGIILSEMGRGWQIMEGGDGDVLASCLHPVYCLPEENWQLYDPAFEEISPAARRSFRMLALPVDGVRRGNSGYVVYEDAPIGAGAGWSALHDLENGFSDGLSLVALLLEEMQKAETLGISIRRLDLRQLIDQPEARVILCGENLRIDPDGAQDMTAADVVEMLLGRYDADPLMAPELKRLLAVNRKAPIEAKRWIHALRYAAEHPYICPKCGKAYMPGTACADCGGAELAFSVRTDLCPHQEMALPADGTPVSLSSLHPGLADENVMRIETDQKNGFLKVVNIGGEAWKYSRGQKTGELRPGQSAYLTAGMRIAIVVRKLQIEYKGLDG